MSLFRLDASIVEDRWREAAPAAQVTRRHLVADPVPGDAWHTAVGAWHIRRN